MPSPHSQSLIPGDWQLKESENFDKFMSALGVSYVVRKLGNASKPLVTMTPTGPNAYEMKQVSLVKTSQIQFKLDEPFEETTADGRKVMVLIIRDNIVGS